MLSRLISLRRGICERAKCPHLSSLKFDDPCAECPAGHWGVYDIIDCNAHVEIIDCGENEKIEPAKEWPLILKPLKLLAKPEDRGLGDIIARKIGPIGGEKYKRWYEKTFGKSCGCDIRQEVWNERYPLPSKKLALTVLL
jgi:hypothetical protein